MDAAAIDGSGPVEVRIFPTVEVIANLNMLDSYAGLMLPLMASATATFLFRQFFMTLPDKISGSGAHGRGMTLGISPEHIALSSQTTGGIPLVMDTLEILGADNLAHGRWGTQKIVVRLPHHDARSWVVRCGCICQKIICISSNRKMDNVYEQLALPAYRRTPWWWQAGPGKHAGGH